MDSIRQYLLTILAAAIICSFAVKMSEKQNLISAIIRLTVILFLSITVITPLFKLQLKDFSGYINTLELDAQEVVTDSKNAASEEAAAIITEKAEAYILNKAASYGVDIQVDVNISDVTSHIPDKVVIIGTISPYFKQILQNVIAEDLGIPKENQIWN